MKFPVPGRTSVASYEAVVLMSAIKASGHIPLGCIDDRDAGAIGRNFSRMQRSATLGKCELVLYASAKGIILLLLEKPESNKVSKWADYGISAVRYDDEHTHIVKVKVHEDKGDTIGSPDERSRQDVVADIKEKLTFVTIVKNADGKWTKGEDVIVVRINGTDFIKTESNNTECDNLENLPEF